MTALGQESYREISDPERLVAAPLVSVLMLVYNHGPYLAEAIEGVLAQRRDFDIELILGEDASSDDSRAIAEDFQRRFPEVVRVVCSNGNVGAYANHRRVFGLARGEFVAYCEGDDYWCHPGKLAAQVALLRADATVAMVHSDWVRARRTSGSWRVDWRHPMHRRMPTSLLQGDLFGCFYYGRILRTCTVLLRRTCVEAFLESPLAATRYRFVDTVRSAFLTSRWKVGHWPEVGSVYRESAGSALRSGRASFIGFLRSALAFDTAARDFFADRGGYPTSYRLECAVGLLIHGLRGGDRVAAREALGDIVRHFGFFGFLRAAAAAVWMRRPGLAWRRARTGGGE